LEKGGTPDFNPRERKRSMGNFLGVIPGERGGPLKSGLLKTGRRLVPKGRKKRLSTRWPSPREFCRSGKGGFFPEKSAEPFSGHREVGPDILKPL